MEAEVHLNTRQEVLDLRERARVSAKRACESISNLELIAGSLGDESLGRDFNNMTAALEKKLKQLEEAMKANYTQNPESEYNKVLSTVRIED